MDDIVSTEPSQGQLTSNLCWRTKCGMRADLELWLFVKLSVMPSRCVASRQMAIPSVRYKPSVCRLPCARSPLMEPLAPQITGAFCQIQTLFFSPWGSSRGGSPDNAANRRLGLKMSYWSFMQNTFSHFSRFTCAHVSLFWVCFPTDLSHKESNNTDKDM